MNDFSVPTHDHAQGQDPAHNTTADAGAQVTDITTPHSTTPPTDNAANHTTAPTSTSEPATQPPTPGVTFADLNLPAPLLTATQDLGFITPSPIQAEAIPALLTGRDVTGIAQTGTGKTAAFGLPLLAAIDPNQRAVQAIVLAPTRELAMQVAEAISSFARNLPDVSVIAVYGGAPYLPQQRALASGTQVVVGTPGRVIDHIERGTLVLDNVRFLVLDEADEMLRMGFAEDVQTILSRTPDTRQIALFSATMPPAIRNVAATHLHNPLEIAVARQATTVTSVHQTYAVVPHRHKIGALVRVLATTEADATIVFTRTRGAAEDVGSALIERGISAATISGDVAQKEREKIVERLRSGALDVLVATDVAARGLDVDRVGLVVNFDLPGEPEAYVHRIGRTGRAGRTGTALAFVTPPERGRLKSIERVTRKQLEEVEVPSPADVSAHKARKLLGKVPARAIAGRLSLYDEIIRENLTEDTDPIELAAILLALAVGDDGPRAHRDQEEYEAEKAAIRKARARDAERTGYDRGARGPRTRGERFTSERHGGDRYLDDRPSRDRAGRKRSGFETGTRYRLAVGYSHGAAPGSIVGALTGEAGLKGSDVGKIDMFSSFSLVDISAPLDAGAMDRISRAKVAGKQLRIRVDQGAPQRGSQRGDRSDRGGDRYGSDRHGSDRSERRGGDRSDRFGQDRGKSRSW